MTDFLPEGGLFKRGDNRVNSLKDLEECIGTGRVIEGLCTVCDSRHNLIVDFGFIKGIIPRNEGAIGIDDGTTRDIALISRVNKPVCFKVTGFSEDALGNKTAVLSRKLAQTECVAEYINRLRDGDIMPVKVTHLEQFGCFVDIGRGLPSLIPIDSISVSRISHPSDRFYVGQEILAVIKSRENGKITLTHKELLGTWEQNAALFTGGETVSGIIRSVESYGVFVELAPNLAGLAESRENARVNQSVSVYIKAIIPEKMKIKLIIVDTFDNSRPNYSYKYYIDSGHIDSWVYSSKEADKIIRTDFSHST